MFLDRSTGRYKVVQWPNLPLLGFLVARVLERVLGLTGTAGDILHWAGTLALLWWAADELIRGVNPFRRMLGGGVLIVLAVMTIAAALR